LGNWNWGNNHNSSGVRFLIKMEFKKSFNELKNPIVWVHYALGTFLLWAVFKFIFNIAFVAQLNFKEIAIFYVAYVFLDRVSHAVLNLV